MLKGTSKFLYLIISLTFQFMHIIYILRSTKSHIKTLKILPLNVSVSFLRPSSGGSRTVFCQVVKLRSVDMPLLWNCVVCARMSLQSVCVCVWFSLLNETLSWSLGDFKVYIVCARVGILKK
jgi:hypothetical protein